MNCPRQTANRPIAAASSMATLVQKNCIKTLTVNNGVVMVNATSNGNTIVGTASPSNSSAGVVGTMHTTHTITGQPIVAASRVLLPHELSTLAVQSQPLHHQTFQFHQHSHPQQLQTQQTIVSTHATTQPQYIFYNNATNQSHLISTPQNQTIPKLAALHYNNVNAASTTTNTTTAGPIILTNSNRLSQPKVIAAAVAANVNAFASNHTIATTTPASTSAAMAKNSRSQSMQINSQSDGIQQNGIASITDNNSSHFSPTTTTNHSTTTTTTTQANDIKPPISSATNNNGSASHAPSPPTPTVVDTVADEVVVAEANEQETEPEPEIDIVINNVVCSFSVRCHLNLREIALNGRNVEFRRENGMVTMKLRRPYTTASIWSSGRITCTGATSEDQAKVGARRYARCLQSLGFPVRFNNFRVVNVLGTCSMPWAIRITNFSERYKQDASYEPELHPGVTYKLKTPKATLKIFSTGSITVTAASVANVQAAIEHIFPLVYEFRKKRAPTEPVPDPIAIVDDVDDAHDAMVDGDDGGSGGGKITKGGNSSKSKGVKRKYPFGMASNDPQEDNMIVSDDDEDDDL